MSTLHTINGAPVTAAAPAVLAIDEQIAAEEKELNATALAEAKQSGAPVLVVPKMQVHRDECGIVGDVGETGDLGSNAK
jgi:hypothetical protein